MLRQDEDDDEDEEEAPKPAAKRKADKDAKKASMLLLAKYRSSVCPWHGLCRVHRHASCVPSKTVACVQGTVSRI